MERWTKAWISAHGSAELKAVIDYVYTGDKDASIILPKEEHEDEISKIKH